MGAGGSTLWGRGGKKEDKHWKLFLATQTLLSHPTFHLEGIPPLFDYRMKQTVNEKSGPQREASRLIWSRNKIVRRQAVLLVEYSAIPVSLKVHNRGVSILLKLNCSDCTGKCYNDCRLLIWTTKRLSRAVLANQLIKLHQWHVRTVHPIVNSQHSEKNKEPGILWSFGLCYKYILLPWPCSATPSGPYTTVTQLGLTLNKSHARTFHNRVQHTPSWSTVWPPFCSAYSFAFGQFFSSQVNSLNHQIKTTQHKIKT